ncbi:hypothetical protein AX16_010253, partial [Volvariella volvacea WC 439]
TIRPLAPRTLVHHLWSTSHLTTRLSVGLKLRRLHSLIYFSNQDDREIRLHDKSSANVSINRMHSCQYYTSRSNCVTRIIEMRLMILKREETVLIS